jgi:hypothetical protein
MPRSRWIRADGRHDQGVEDFQPVAWPEWSSAAAERASPGSIVVRALRDRIEVPGFRAREVTPVTTLTDAAADPAAALAGLEGTRWRGEGPLKSLKQAMKMDVWKCVTVDGVLKELTRSAPASNLMRVARAPAAPRRGVEGDRVSFLAALRRRRGAESAAAMPELVVKRLRPGRSEPRCQRRRPKPDERMRGPRAEWRRRLREQDLAG